MHEDKRRARRFDLSLPVKVVTVGERDNPADVKTRDISSSGMFIEMDEKVPSGTKVQFEVDLPQEITQAGPVRLRCLGRVVRVDRSNARMGVAVTIERYEFVRAVESATAGQPV